LPVLAQSSSSYSSLPARILASRGLVLVRLSHGRQTHP
jgi:hypothetical protein